MINPESPTSQRLTKTSQSPADSPSDPTFKPEASFAASFSFHDIASSLEISADLPSKSISRVLEFESSEFASINLQSSQRSLPLLYAQYDRHAKRRSFGEDVVNSQDTVRVSKGSMYSIGSVIDFAKPRGHHQRIRSSVRSSQDLKSSFNITNISHAVKSSLTSDLTYSPDVSHMKQEPQSTCENSAPLSVSAKSCNEGEQPFSFENKVRGSSGLTDQSLGCHPAKTYCPQCDRVVLTDVTMQLPEIDL